MTLSGLIEAMERGEERALARAISFVEDRRAGWLEIMQWAGERPHAGVVLGLTGAPGAGKSTLCNALASHMLAEGEKLAIMAVDPSSPVTKGALLGDRIRMTAAEKPGCFIRSLASRGALGGLCESGADVATLLRAFGFDIVLLETVGVGQAAFDVFDVADSVAAVCAPGQGDDVQALKAGVIEVADVIVLNKGDDPKADDAEAFLREAARPNAGREGRAAHFVRTDALRGDGVAALAEALGRSARGPRAITSKIQRMVSIWKAELAQAALGPDLAKLSGDFNLYRVLREDLRVEEACAALSTFYERARSSGARRDA